MSTDIDEMDDSNTVSLSTRELLIGIGIGIASPLLLILALILR
jgi:hypothetical protein